MITRHGVCGGAPLVTTQDGTDGRFALREAALRKDVLLLVLLYAAEVRPTPSYPR